MKIKPYKVLATLVLMVCNLPTSLAEEKPSYRMDLSWPAPATSPPWLYEKLKDIDLAPNGDVYISDKRKIYKFNAQGEFIEIWKSGLLENYSIEIRSDGDVYLSEHNRQRIRKFNPAGDFISTWSGNYGRLFTVENGNIYTINNGKIFQYTEQEEFIRKWNIVARSDVLSGRNWNKHIAIEPKGDIYIVTHPRVTRHFSATGEHLDSSGSNANTRYETRFRSIATRVDGSLYTEDSSKYLWKWNDSSTLIFGYAFPDPVIKFASDGSIFILTEAGNIKQFSAIGTLIHNWGNDAILAKEGMLDRPKGLSVAPDGSVYVADTYNHRIQQFSATGDFIRTWGNKGVENGQFKYPHDVVVNTNGDIYVTDVGNKRIQQFGSAGNFIRSWRVNLPKKIAISPGGSIYVFHFSNPGSQVSHFSLSGVVIPSLNEKDLPLSLRLEEDDIGGFSGSVDDIAIAPDGSIYIADSSNDRILKVIPEKK